MPNWSRSRIAITLPELEFDDPQAMRQIRWERFRDLKNHIIEVDEDETGNRIEPFNILHPRPADKDDDWYDWNANNWGTKWDLCYGHGEILGDKTIILQGDTAWCPPVELLDYLERELGFLIEAQHFSYENNMYGDTICGEHNFHELYSAEIDVEDFNDHMALEIKEWEDENGEDIQDHILHHYILFGEWGDRGYQFWGDILDSDWINARVEWDAERALEDYINWKEQHGNNQGIKELKNHLLELIEENLELKRIKEGKYLEFCNKLKTISTIDAISMVEDLRDIQNNMIHYYNKDSVEPQLIGIYC
tara:strand:- start:1755 stop:2675 length:921 start_codon:yes stop_codon:yes gene_type:complete